MCLGISCVIVIRVPGKCWMVTLVDFPYALLIMLLFMKLIGSVAYKLMNVFFFFFQLLFFPRWLACFRMKSSFVFMR